MFKKNKIGTIIGVILFLILLSFTIYRAQKLLESKVSIVKNQDFFEQEEDFDVLFLGTSHTLNSVLPMELWEDYGIVSYNLAGKASRLPLSYWTMINALDYTTPKLIVVDTFQLSSDAKVHEDLKVMHYALDSFPMSRHKYQAVMDLYDDKSSDRYGERWEYLWNFTSFHYRWNELEASDFQIEHSVNKGAEEVFILAEPNPFVRIPIEQKIEENTVGKDYLRKIIEECQSRGIDVLLTHIPYPAEEYFQMEANSVYEIAEEYGVDYINFLQLDVVNYETDCYDADNHLNISGARKITDYLGQYITRRYAIDDRRNDARYSKWHEDYENYRSREIGEIMSFEKLTTYLMAIADKHISVGLFVKKDSELLKDAKIQELIENVAGTDKLLMETAADAGQDYWLFVDNAEKKITESVGEEPIENIMGDLAAVGVNCDADVKIVVYDIRTKEPVDTAVFTAYRDDINGVRQYE